MSEEPTAINEAIRRFAAHLEEDLYLLRWQGPRRVMRNNYLMERLLAGDGPLAGQDVIVITPIATNQATMATLLVKALLTLQEQPLVTPGEPLHILMLAMPPG